MVKLANVLNSPQENGKLQDKLAENITWNKLYVDIGTPYKNLRK